MHAKWTDRQLLITDAKKQTATTIQATQIQKRRTLLLKRIHKFTKALPLFMPGLYAYLAAQGAPEVIDSALQPEEIKIYLPSSIPATHRKRVCISGLSEIEERLRFAQTHESLSSLRRHLRTRIMASKLTSKNASSQRAYIR